MGVKLIALFCFLLDLKNIKCQLLEEIDPEFLDINDMFPFYTKSPDSTALSKPSNVIVRNISIDLEKIDIEKFRKKLDKYRSKFADYNKEVAELNETRRMAYQWYDRGRTEWNRAQEHIVKTKCLDMALQIIYMARHKIRQMETLKYFNRHDTSYRIAFLYRRLRRMWKKMMDIMTTMRKRKHDAHGAFAWVRAYLVLHHKTTILHVDFVYMWWVLMNLHEKYRLAHYIPNTPPLPTKPPPNVTTTSKPAL